MSGIYTKQRPNGSEVLGATSFRNTAEMIGGASIVVAGGGGTFQSPVLDVAGFTTFMVICDVTQAGTGQLGMTIVTVDPESGAAIPLTGGDIPSAPQTYVGSGALATRKFTFSNLFDPAFGAGVGNVFILVRFAFTTVGVGNATVANARLWASALAA